MQQTQIDLVISWVDGNDYQWLQARAAARNKTIQYSEGLNHPARFREIGLLKYAFRSIEKNLPWVRNIYLVTPGQIPAWLNKDHPKVKVVDQNTIIPKDYQPCFKSTGVEWHLHRIPGLSENFIYINDDMIFTQPLTPKDFFHKGLPRLTAIYHPLPIADFSHMVLSTLNVLNRNFIQGKIAHRNINKFFNPLNGRLYLRNIIYRSLDRFSSRESLQSSYIFPHVALPLRKSTLETIWEKEFNALDATCRNPFRDKSDIIIWLAMFWEIESGTFVPQNPATTQLIYANELEILKKTLNDKSVSMLCLNDTENIETLSETMIDRIDKLMNLKFPKISSFETIQKII